MSMVDRMVASVAVLARWRLASILLQLPRVHIPRTRGMPWTDPSEVGANRLTEDTRRRTIEASRDVRMVLQRRTPMTRAREMMHLGAECIQEGDTLADAARKMRDLNVGSLPICGDDDRLHGIITDRDIVVKCIAEGCDPETVRAGEYEQGTPVWVNADADEDEVLQLMEEHRIRRLPVIDDNRLVGMISEADVARRLPEDKVAHFVETIYSAP
jgi:CBS domain-containing protein